MTRVLLLPLLLLIAGCEPVTTQPSTKPATPKKDTTGNITPMFRLHDGGLGFGIDLGNGFAVGLDGSFGLGF